MKKIEYLEAINERLQNKFHLQTLAIYLSMAYNQIIYLTFRKDIDNLDLYSKRYDDIDVKYDQERDMYYSDLPATIIQLPGAGDGVRRIATKQGRKIEFVPVGNILQLVHNDLEVGQMEGPTPFRVIDSNVVEYTTKNGIDQVDKVTMYLAVQFEEFGMMDEINIPSGQDQTIMDLIIQFSQGKPVEKEINDQSDKTK